MKRVLLIILAAFLLLPGIGARCLVVTLKGGQRMAFQLDDQNVVMTHSDTQLTFNGLSIDRSQIQEFRIHELKMQVRRLMAPAPKLNVSTVLPDQHINFYDKGGRLALTTRCSNVLYIEAADNYANIHYINDGKEDMFILHNSLKDIEKDYLSMGLLRCHRGYMVNVDNVKLMRRDKASFVLEMNKTARTIPVSKSYADQVTQYFSGKMN